MRNLIPTSLRGLLLASVTLVVAAACAVSDETPDNTSEDVPDELNTDSNQDGLDGTVASAIFVSPGGNDVAPGTKDAPVRTLSTALEKAKAAQKTQIIMASGTYPESKTVNLVDGIGIYGGYEPKENWKRGSNVTEIDGAEVAMVLRSANKKTRLGRVTVKSSDPVNDPGASSVVLVAVDATDLVVEDKCVLAAGKGLPGVAGKDGAKGDDGKNGEQGKGGAVDNQSSPGAGGNPGVNASCTDANGGLGGKGGADPNFQGAAGGPSALAVKGGPGGQTNGCTGASGTQGDTGANDGEAGADGVPGKNVGAFDVSKMAYVPSTGGDGTPGVSGPGGGGGGGSGGQTGLSCVDGSGNGGGGGGAGGCGGGGGTGGSGGGASIAIIAVRTPVTVTNCELSTFGGGAGGAGGTGGDGGLPGSGGPIQGSGAGEIGTGAKGGDGRKGGRGGAGAGGGGGPSVGIWAEGAGPKVTKVTYKLGPAGVGGSSSGATGSGQKGVEKEIGP